MILRRADRLSSGDVVRLTENVVLEVAALERNVGNERVRVEFVPVGEATDRIRCRFRCDDLIEVVKSL